MIVTRIYAVKPDMSRGNCMNYRDDITVPTSNSDGRRSPPPSVAWHVSCESSKQLHDIRMNELAIAGGRMPDLPFKDFGKILHIRDSAGTGDLGNGLVGGV